MQEQQEERTTHPQPPPPYPLSFFRACHWVGEDVEMPSGQEDMPTRATVPTAINASAASDTSDTRSTQYCVTVYGKTPEGERVVLRMPFCPYFAIEIGLRAPRSEVEHMLTSIKGALGPEGGYRGMTFRKGRSFLGYAPPESSGFCVLSFRSLRAMKRAAWWLSRNRPRVKQYESNVDPLIRFFHARDVRPCGIFAFRYTVNRRFSANDLVRVVEDDDRTVQSSSVVNIPPTLRAPLSRSVVIASFDIECLSSTGDFPDPTRREDAVFMICTAYSRTGTFTDPYRISAISVGQVERRDREDASTTGGIVDVVCVRTEAELLRAWAEDIAREDADVLAGYNIWGFDMRYIYHRVLLNGGALNPMLSDFAVLLSKHNGRVRERDDEEEEEPRICLDTVFVKGGGAQTHEASMLRTRGVLQLDVYYYLRRFHANLRSYKLDDVARALLGGTDGKKTGLSIKDMQRLWREGSAEEKWDVAAYCVQDAVLVNALIHRVTAIDTVFEMANVCRVPPETILLQGEQVKVHSLILGYAMARGGMFCPVPIRSSLVASFAAKKQKRDEEDPQKEDDDEDLEEEGKQRDDDDPTVLKGATVLEPRVGAYWKPVACLDFQSLYPSIMMAHNLCHSTLVVEENKKGGGEGAEEHPDEAKTIVEGTHFVKPLTDDKRGILPQLLTDLQVKRAESKRAMAIADDPYARAVFNAKQLAYKVSMNAVYGFCGVSEKAGLLPCIPLANAVTAIGRSMICESKRIIEEGFPGATIVYGDTDSLMIEFGIDASAGRDQLKAVKRAGDRAAEIVTRAFPRPIKFCFEKCYLPYLIFSKKRYVGLAMDGEDCARGDDIISDTGTKRAKGAVDCKGVQFVRRDTCAFVKAVCERMIDVLLYDMDVDLATQEVRVAAMKLLGVGGHSPPDLSQLVVSKTVKASARDILCDIRGCCTKCGASKGSATRACPSCGNDKPPAYKNTASPAIHVACKLECEHPGNGPKAGDAVEFVFVDRRMQQLQEQKSKRSSQQLQQPSMAFSSSATAPALCCEMAEHPDRVRRYDMVPDYRYYFDHHLKGVVTEIMALAHGRSKPDVERMLFGDLVREHELSRDKQPSIVRFLSRRDGAQKG